MSRTQLTADLTIPISNGGTKFQDAWEDLKAHYDLGGFKVRLQAASGYVGPGLVATGNLVGQFSQGQVEVIGDTTNPDNCVVMPTSGDCFSGAIGANYILSGFRTDLTNSNPCGEGIVTVGANSLIQLGRPGDVKAFSFGNHPPVAQGVQYNDVTVNGGGKLWVAPGQLEFFTGATTQKQCMFDIGDGGSVLFQTNGNPALLNLNTLNTLTYIAGIFRFDSGSHGILGASYTGPVLHGQQWWVDGFSSLVTYTPFGDMPGDVAGYTGPAGQVRQQ